ncbi:S9 family peptidase [Amycolatopsis cihanbeyliensis]|uniref:Dipeptidyl aminopeptidase/acylaminoacyl peptidase n=1 Tax=Amycolatopsis cihanbeyliensis TaxID=1128664 RepID=A0A542DEN0_AMYCI|nr:S9 family peptidase [Amycolatopsis cihanbeyliensis]TQJ01538.1 dipeptidyl aminopeptidase/acylaminoacyl peptidase [Amycolatopsis cihanbeyliensis]
MRPTDLELLTVPCSPTLHGDLLLIALSRPDLADNRYRSVLRKVGLDGEDRPWSTGEQDSSPVISPDGRQVAFLRVGGARGSVPQLHVMPVGGGESVRLTDLPLGAGPAVWAPDSRRIAFTARVPEPGRYGTPVADGSGWVPEPDEEAPRRITRLDYRLDDVGFLLDRPRRLFVLDVSTLPESGPQETPRPLTDNVTDVEDPAWTADGRSVLVVAARDWGRAETLHRDLYAVPADGGDPVLAVRTEGNALRPMVDGDTVWFYGAEFGGVDFAARNAGLWSATLRVDGTPTVPRKHTDTESVDCVPDAGGPARYADGVLVVVRNRGAAELRLVPRHAEAAELGELPTLTGPRDVVRDFDVDGDRIAAVIAGPESMGEVVLLDGDDGRGLTDFAAPLRGAGIRPRDELTTESVDGYPVHGWLVLPEGPGPHPVLLAVHGGPFARYEWSFFDEAQVYAAAGYAVVLANPRGSAGYGQAHGRAVVGRFGTVDADDLLAMLDAALSRPELDATRVGVMGGSYGGFMTTWLAAHHGERFRAAWSERAVNAWDSFAGSSDVGWEFVQGYEFHGAEVQRDRSPLSYAEKIDIPFAVVHSEHDWRCPVEQAQRLFVALRRAGTEAELLLFPGEGHELSRSGKPRHRLQRFEAVLDWWSRHLGTGVSSA